MSSPPWATRVLAPNPSPMTLDGTNTWVLREAPGANAIVVDPGPLDEGHLTTAAGHRPIAVAVVTHRHPDHYEGAPRFGELAGVAALAPPYDEDPAAASAPPLPDWLSVVATPGHSADSVCLVADLDPPAVLTGDTVLGFGTTVVAHPDGRLGDYLDSLRRLRELVDTHGITTLLPGHGPVVTDAAPVLDYYLAHRAERLDQVRAAVDAGAVTPQDVVERVYADVDRSLWPAALLSVRAQLDYLGEVGVLHHP